MADTDDHRRPLRIIFIPLLTPGHMIPLIHIANLFARRPNIAATLITTPGNEHLARPSLHPSVHLHLLHFPSHVTHLLPNNRENLTSISSSSYGPFMVAVLALQPPLHHLLLDLRPDAIVSDAFFTETAVTAADLGIPRIVFHGPGAFPLCVHESLEIHAPHENLNSDSFVVEGLPHKIEMRRPEISSIFDYPEMLRLLREAEEKSFGVIVNSFYQLEPEYADLYRSKPGRRVWFVGPTSLYSHVSKEEPGSVGGTSPGSQVSTEEPGSVGSTSLGSHASKEEPGFAGPTSLGSHVGKEEPERLLMWLDTKAAGSVLYVCFGSLCEFTAGQLRVIADGLEASGHPFVWVVKDADVAAADWLPEGFEERVEGRGLIVRGWAPQVVVLGHVAVGGFVTHCGWNSTLEGVAAGVVMATWPLFFEQFVNERFITEVTKVGVRVRKGREVAAAVGAEEVAATVERVMGCGEEAEGMRRRAREYKAMARAAMEVGGSSYEDLTHLIAEISNYRGNEENV